MMLVDEPQTCLSDYKLKELKQLLVHVEAWGRTQNVSGNRFYIFQGCMTFDGPLFIKLGVGRIMERKKPVEVEEVAEPILKRKKRLWWLPFRKGGGRG